MTDIDMSRRGFVAGTGLSAAALLSGAARAATAVSDEFKLSTLPSYTPRGPVSGLIRTWGAGTEMMKLLQERFRTYHPQVTFESNFQSTALAVPALSTKVADLGVMGREIWPMEVLQYRRAHDDVPPLTLEIATGSYNVPYNTWAIMIVVNKNCPITKLNMKQLDGIFGSERSGGFDKDNILWLPENGRGPEENIRTWGQLGATGAWKDKPINVYGFDFVRNGISNGFAQTVFNGGDKWNERLHEFSILIKPDGKVVPPQPQLAAAISKDPYGIGYNGMQYMTPDIRPLAIAPGNTTDYVVPLALVVPMTENSIGPAAYRPGDVIGSLAGLSIEVQNTDAEGRLVLADGITYALREYKPAYLLDIATLTGAVMSALHEEYAALYANDDGLADALIAAADAAQEPLWRMPLSARQDYLVESTVADVSNLGAGGFLGIGGGSSIAGAKFLERFVTGVKWAHLDIAGTAWATRRTPRSGPGATGFGVALIDRWFASLERSAG